MYFCPKKVGRKKLSRFADNEKAPNIIQPGKELFNTIRGHWRSHFFKNEAPIVLEVGCGRGEYTTGLAPHFPDKNFVGVDIKGSRIWKGSQVALEQKLSNVGFLRIHIQNLEQYFAPDELDEIWITFPDPRPKDGDEHRRLTYTRFLAMYQRLMKKDGLLHLKTDNNGLFEYTLELVQALKVRDLVFTRDLDQSPLNKEHYGIETTYEKKFGAEGFKMKYLRCRLPLDLEIPVLHLEKILAQNQKAE